MEIDFAQKSSIRNRGSDNFLRQTTFSLSLKIAYIQKSLHTVSYAFFTAWQSIAAT